VILYLDTSSLIKLYVEEEGSEAVRSQVASASLLATSVVTYPEVCSVLSRFGRERRVTKEEQEALRRQLDSHWLQLIAIPVEERLWRHAGDLALRHGLRGLDSIHLASFLGLIDQRNRNSAEFSSFDERLNRAARLEASS